MGRRTALLLAVLALPWGTALAARSPQELRAIESEIQRQQNEAVALEDRERATTVDLQDLQRQMVAAAEALQKRQSEQDGLEEKLATLEKEAGGRLDSLRATRERLGLLAGALLRVSRQPPVTFLFHDEREEDPLRRAVLLRAILPRLQAESNALALALQELEDLRRATETQRRLVAAARANLERQRDNLDLLVKTRQDRLNQTAAQKAALREQIGRLAAEARDLRQLLEKVDRVSVWPRDKAPPVLRAGLRLPIAGRLARGYGHRDADGVANQGLTLEAAPGSPVVAPRDGRVAFAGPFRGYGQIVLMQHPDGYHSFMAGFGKIDAQVGQNVLAGEPLGSLPASGSGRRELYFEWRHHGETLDPFTQTSPAAAR